MGLAVRPIVQFGLIQLECSDELKTNPQPNECLLNLSK